MAKGHRSKKLRLANAASRKERASRRDSRPSSTALLNWVEKLFNKHSLGNDTIFYHSPIPAQQFHQCGLSDETTSECPKPNGLWSTWGLLRGTSFLNWEVKEEWFTSGYNYICTFHFKESAVFTYKVDYQGDQKPVLVVTPKNLDAFAEKYVITYKEGERYELFRNSSMEECEKFLENNPQWRRYECNINYVWKEKMNVVEWTPNYTRKYFNHKWLMENFAGLMFRDYPTSCLEKLSLMDRHMWYSGIDADSMVVWDAHVVDELRTLAEVPKKFIYKIKT